MRIASGQRISYFLHAFLDPLQSRAAYLKFGADGLEVTHHYAVELDRSKDVVDFDFLRIEWFADDFCKNCELFFYGHAGSEDVRHGLP